MFRTTLVIFTAALAAVSSVVADHAIHFHNNCGQEIQPLIKNTAKGVTYKGPFLPNGGTASASVAEAWASGIVLGLRHSDSAPDCPGCTRLECDFASAGYHNCNLSRVSGFSIGMGFSWSAAGCNGAACKAATCPPANAWNPGSNDAGSLRFCQAGSVALTVNFCPA